MEQNNTTRLPIEFTGKATEFFGIWIVNVLLIIITLGFYTPWAKVRTKRYFYGNTVLDNSAFDYTADPIAILKGYLIALLFFIIYSVAINYYPMSQFIFILVFLAILPWLVVRSMLFRARNTVFRNIRFTFKKKYGEAFAIFAGLPLLLPLTLGLILPHLAFKQNKFLVDNSGFGTSPFSFHARSKDFYKIYAIILVFLLIPIIAAIAIPAYQAYKNMAQASQFVRYAEEGPEFAVFGMVFSILIYLVFFAYMESRVKNLVWNNIEIAKSGFESSLRARDLLWFYFSNLLAIALSFGLLIPWARIRLARYRMRKLAMHASTNLDGFIKQEQENVGATGDEIGELFDVDIGL